jgi:hypothetical protein
VHWRPIQSAIAKTVPPSRPPPPLFLSGGTLRLSDRPIFAFSEVAGILLGRIRFAAFGRLRHRRGRLVADEMVRPVLDLGGLVDQRSGELRIRGRLCELKQHGRCLAGKFPQHHHASLLPQQQDSQRAIPFRSESTKVHAASLVLFVGHRTSRDAKCEHWISRGDHRRASPRRANAAGILMRIAG